MTEMKNATANHPIARLLKVALLAAGLALSGCVVQMPAEPSYAPAMPLPRVADDPTDGAVYQDGRDVRLFEDLRAHRVGDILTVQLSEATTAAKSSSTSTGKSSSASIAGPTLFGRPVTDDGIEILSGSLSGSSQFNGEGTSSQSNSLAGDITVTVVERLANGNLVIRGEKWVTLNQGKEFIQLSGIIRPYDIDPSNTVASSKIADARITYSSKGVLANANKAGILQRFFQSMWFPN